MADELFTRTKGSGAEVIKKKGGAGFAVGIAIRDVIHAIALDQRRILPVSIGAERLLRHSRRGAIGAHRRRPQGCVGPHADRPLAEGSSGASQERPRPPSDARDRPQPASATKAGSNWKENTDRHA